MPLYDPFWDNLGVIVQGIILGFLFLLSVMYALAPFVLYGIYRRLGQIRELLCHGAALPAAMPRQDNSPRLILPSGPAGFGPQRALVIAAGIVGLAMLLMIGWMVTR